MVDSTKSYENNPGESIGLKFIPSQSELFRFIPISVSEQMRIIPNQYEKRFVSRLMKNGQKSTRLNPINSETSIWMNLNQSETQFSIQNPISNWSKPNFHSESIGMNPRSEWFRLKIRFGSVRTRIDLNWKFSFGLVRIKSDWFLPFFVKRDTKCFSDWFGMIRIGSNTKIGMNRNSSDWLRMNFNPILPPGKRSLVTKNEFFDWIY